MPQERIAEQSPARLLIQVQWANLLCAPPFVRSGLQEQHPQAAHLFWEPKTRSSLIRQFLVRAECSSTGQMFPGSDFATWEQECSSEVPGWCAPSYNRMQRLSAVVAEVRQSFFELDMTSPQRQQRPQAEEA